MRIKEFINPKDLKITYFTNLVNISNYDDIILLNDNKIILKKTNKFITIKGENLRINKLSIDTSEVIVEGNIYNMAYSEEHGDNKSGFLSKIFK